MASRKNDSTLSNLNKLASHEGRRRNRTELREDQIAEIKEAFELFDVDKMGKIDYHEIKVALRALGFEVNKSEVLELMNEYDTSNSGYVDYKGFHDIVARKIFDRDPMTEINRAFQLFDDDKTGKISLKNLRRVSRELGENLTDNELEAMIEEFDKDMDGEISKEEFINIMKQAAIC
ncbi:Centrin-3 [Babesia microti strain RI]|uniref:Centrin-3 n=1 Tax=Babesia microti (strain RI) TaxID=1133968 RepID=I7IPW9_BABMR|nr:Centrin-3 [Babesia microti strain RI]CCF73285.1 Centrin-3 [Babesia microti strain RI]|eukprot:XP_012647894.1 Centrin-3 [Babesia microti strain RI]